MLKNKLIFTSSTVILLVGLTLMLLYVDVGYVNGNIGLFVINNFFATYQINSSWDLLTTIILDVTFVMIFAVVGVGIFQAIKRKSILKICRNVVVTEALIVLMLVSSILLSNVIFINNSPVLQNGVEVSSYPSNHIVIVTFMFLTSATLIKDYFEIVKIGKINIICKIISFVVAISIIALMVVGKTLSGRIWFTDAISGLLFGMFFYSLFLLFKEKSIK